MIKYLVFLCLLLQLTACGSSENAHYAPVVDAYQIESVPKTGLHRVKHGETLYAIAWRYGLDYRYLAKRNRLKSPYVIFTGQIIDLRGDQEFIHVPNLHLTAHLPQVHATWIKPTNGRIIQPFSLHSAGLDIVGTPGSPIYAAQGGQVVYCGNGIPGYGNLIIIKHNGEYMSAYAHSQQLFVKEGDVVQQGQKIAQMGNSGSNKTMLHFEIRRLGKPIDPLLLVRF